MTSNRTQLIARLPFLTALTVVILGYYTKLPTPTGIVTLLDLKGRLFTAFYLHTRKVRIVGGVEPFLPDLISGYPQWMFLASSFTGDKAISAGLRQSQYSDLLLATVVMVAVVTHSFCSLFLGNGWGLLSRIFRITLAQEFCWNGF